MGEITVSVSVDQTIQVQRYEPLRVSASAKFVREVPDWFTDDDRDNIVGQQCDRLHNVVSEKVSEWLDLDA